MALPGNHLPEAMQQCSIDLKGGRKVLLLSCSTFLSRGLRCQLLIFGDAKEKI